PERVKEEIENIIGLDASEALPMSAKTGVGVAAVLEAIVKKIPPPVRGSKEAPLRALVYDSWFDSYLGVVVQIRVIDGELRANDTIRFCKSGAQYEVYKTGVFTPHAAEVKSIASGEV